MNWLHALLLGIVQGCTEFFPISSSTHLKIVQMFFQISPGTEPLFLSLSCHLGTLCALALYFRHDIWEICWKNPRKMLFYVTALVPLMPAYFLLKKVRAEDHGVYVLSLCLVMTAVMLFFAHWKKRGVPHKNVGWKEAIWIGIFQGFALIPGISRSGATITAGLWRGVSIQESVRFSFLLSIPAIAGGALLESIKTVQLSSSSGVFLTPCIIGFVASALTGIVVVRLAIPVLEKGTFKPFGWYSLVMAAMLFMVYR